MENRGKLIKSSISSRIIVILIQYFGNVLIPDHDANVFLYPTEEKRNQLDTIIQHFLGGFLRWDAQYFMHIAKYGYTYENALAFFPMYPCTARLISDLISCFVPFISQDTLLLLIFLLINICFFTLAVISLYNITSILFNEEIAIDACHSFCYNPASIFFVAPYTESMFSYFTFQSILNCLHLYQDYAISYRFRARHILYLLPVALGTATRSNGILNLGFLLYTFMCMFIESYPRVEDKIRHCLIYLCISVVASVLVLVPFIAYQVYCFYWFCTDFELNLPNVVVDFGLKKNFVLPGQFSIHNQTWCYKSIPLAYSYVQDHYWDVGFLKYYELKQTPNFLLALPVLSIIITNCYIHIKHNFRKNFATFSFNYMFRKKLGTFRKQLFSPLLNVFVVHSIFLALLGILFIHVQVSVRMICSSTPLLYWYVIKNPYDLGRKRSQSYWLYFENNIRLVFFIYFVIGTIIFCNFLPWT